MARIFTDGAETGDMSFWSTYSVSTVSTTTPQNGSYHYIVTGSSSNVVRSFAAVTEGFWRFRLRWEGTQQQIIKFRNSTTDLLTLTLTYATQKIAVTTATTGDTGSNSFLSNRSTLVEVHYKIADASGEIEIKIDGVSKFTFTGDTKPGAATTIDNFIINGFSGANYLYVDDIAMNDTSGSSDNSWCGDGKVIALTPNGDGDSSQWLGSDGNSTNNYQLVDELPPSNTDYVTTSGSGYIDNYALTSYTLSGTESVGRVWTVSVSRDVAAAGTLNLGLKTNSTNYTVGKLLGTSFGRVETSGYALNPNTGAAWTQAQLDALQSTIEMP